VIEEVLQSRAAHTGNSVQSFFPGIYLNPIRGEIAPVRLNKRVLVSLAFALAALPVWAAHIDSIDWAPTRTMTIGGTQIPAGTYSLRAEEGKSELRVIGKGKVVATIPCHWTQLPSKASDSQVASDGDKVTQVQFAGHASAVQFDQ
jgi:hypothetical protein